MIGIDGEVLARYEPAARKLCELRELNPDLRVMYPHPKGYAVACYCDLWERLAVELLQHDQRGWVLDMHPVRREVKS